MRHSLPLLGSAVLLAASAAYADLDLTTAGANGYVNTSFWQQVPDQSTGTGIIEPFLRIQNNGTESGYNTDGTLEFDSKAGPWTHALLLTDVPIKVLSDGIAYRQFLLDINQNQGSDHELLSLNTFILYQSDSNTLTGYPGGGFGAPIYDLDSAGNQTIEMNYLLNPGSGAGDVYAYVPDSLFNGKTYVYMYNEFGQPHESNDGFEEWAIVGTSDNRVPSPGAAVLGLIGLVPLAARRRAA